MKLTEIKAILGHWLDSRRRLCRTPKTSTEFAIAISEALVVLNELPDENEPQYPEAYLDLTFRPDLQPPPERMLQVGQQTFSRLLNENNELRKRRDELLAANNRLVEERRAMKKGYGR